MSLSFSEHELAGSKTVFSPGNLTTARQWRGLTKKELALKLQVSQQTITDYESGETQPTDLRSIADVLCFPMEFFVSDEIEEIPDSAVTFRSKRALTLPIKSRTLGRCKVAASRVAPEFRKRFRLPQADIPELDLGITPEQAARALRHHWQIGGGPIGNLTHLLEAKGINVFWLNDESPCVFAFSFWRNNLPFAFINLANGSGERARFSLAHELGHLILHREVDKGLTSHTIESQANDFASAFLLPREQFLAELPKTPSFTTLLSMKKRWGTSIQAMIVRGRQLDVYSQWYYENAFKEISRRGWKITEPNPLPFEASFNHNYIYTKLSEKNIYPDEIASQMGIGEAELCELTPEANKFCGRRLKHLILTRNESSDDNGETSTKTKPTDPLKKGYLRLM